MNHQTSESALKPPLLSLIVISDNHEDFIEVALQICIEQPCPETEIIVSDDAYKDQTAAFVRKCCETDDPIKLYVSKADRGAKGNGQFALSECKGKYIAMLDGNDYCHFEQIKNQVEIIELDIANALSYSQCQVILGFSKLSVRTTGVCERGKVTNANELAKVFAIEKPKPAAAFRSAGVPQEASVSSRTASAPADWLLFMGSAFHGQWQFIKWYLTDPGVHAKSIGTKLYKQIEESLNSFQLIVKNYQTKMLRISASKTEPRRHLLGTLYSTIIYRNSYVQNIAMPLYRERHGTSLVYFLIRMCSRIESTSAILFFKVIIKKVVL